MLAHEHGMESALGGILNELGDVVSDAALYLPFALIPGLHAPARGVDRRAGADERDGWRRCGADRGQPSLRQGRLGHVPVYFTLAES